MHNTAISNVRPYRVEMKSENPCANFSPVTFALVTSSAETVVSLMSEDQLTISGLLQVANYYQIHVQMSNRTCIFFIVTIEIYNL